jgi:hypothetical protein
LPLVGLLATLSACGGIRDAVKMQNPLVAGSVPSNEAEERRDYFERLYELDSGVFTTKASIKSLTKSEVCFETRLRWISEQGDETDDESFVDVSKLLPKLEGKPDLTIEKAKVEEAAPIEHSTLQGKTTETQSSYERVCDAAGRNCVDRMVERRVPKEVTMSVIDGGGTLCFEHGGRIDEQTQWLELVLRPPSHPDAETHRFAWKFEPSPK